MRRMASPTRSSPMRRLLLVLAFSCSATGSARANLVVTIGNWQQRMSGGVDGEDRYKWPVSTARTGYVTPNGTYHPEFRARRWFSHQYYGSPMPHAIFLP